jgi:hypothetical protein
MVETNWHTEHVSDNSEIRTFSSEQLFEWHQDDETRAIKVIAISGEWLFQFDDSIPITLQIDSAVIIDKDIWHRLISMTTFGKISLLVTKFV